MTSGQEPPQETPARGDGPGQQLRAAREAQGLQLNQIGERLHLREELVKALENDDYDHLPSAVFVRGYIRNYARALNMDEIPLLQAFDRINPKPRQEPVAPQPPRHRLPRVTHHNQLIIRLVTWGILLFFIAMLVIWVWNHVDWSALSLPGGAKQDADSEELLLPQEQSGPEMIPPLEGGDKATRTPPPRSRDTETQPNTGTAPTKPPMAAARKGLPTAATQPTEKSREAGRTQPAQAVGPTSITDVALAFNGPCWVDIRGKDGDKVLVGEIDAGARRVLHGTPPFTMLIGNAPAVRITIGGRPFDLARYTKGRVARLTLDPRKAE